tara:strand:+ start:502 stop:699 length:198 start_codon:yes stop_codon:yes gene_type:complete
VSLNDINMGLPEAKVEDRLNFKKVKGSITEIRLPKFEINAIEIDIKIIGIWKFLIFNLMIIFRDI